MSIRQLRSRRTEHEPCVEKRPAVAAAYLRQTAIAVALVFAGTNTLAQTLTPDKPVFTADEAILVHYGGMPENDGTNWIALAVPSAPPDTNSYISFEYLSEEGGSHEFGKLDPGDYELRGYFNWPDDGYTLRLRQPFRVVLPTGASLDTSKDTYEENEPIVVTFAGMPGNARDWIAVSKLEAPVNGLSYEDFQYLEAARDGQLDFTGLPAGDYEVRAYWDFPRGGYEAILARYPFRVGDAEPLQARLTFQPEEGLAGDDVLYRVTLENSSAEAIGDIEVLTTLGWEGELESEPGLITPPGASCREEDELRYRCTINLLAANASLDLDFRHTETRAGTMSVQIEVQSSSGEPFEAGELLIYPRRADLVVDVLEQSGPVFWPGSTQAVIRVSNEGRAPAIDPMLTLDLEFEEGPLGGGHDLISTDCPAEPTRSRDASDRVVSLECPIGEPDTDGLVTLYPGQERTLTATIEHGASGSLKVDAWTSSGNASSESDSLNLNVRSVEVRVEWVESPESVMEGEPATFKAMVTKESPPNAPISIHIDAGSMDPEGIRLVVQDTYVCDRGEARIECDLGVTSPGVPVLVEFEITAERGGEKSVIVDVGSPGVDAMLNDSPNSRVVADYVVVEPPSLTAEISAPRTSFDGLPLEYTITVRNDGPVPAHNVWIRHTGDEFLRTSERFVPDSCLLPTETNDLECSVAETLAPGQSESLSLSVTPDAGLRTNIDPDTHQWPMTSSAVAFWDREVGGSTLEFTSDPTTTLLRRREARLEIETSGSPVPPRSGEPFEWVVSATNVGGTAAFGVVVWLDVFSFYWPDERLDDVVGKCTRREAAGRVRELNAFMLIETRPVFDIDGQYAREAEQVIGCEVPRLEVDEVVTLTMRHLLEAGPWQRLENGDDAMRTSYRLEYRENRRSDTAPANVSGAMFVSSDGYFETALTDSFGGRTRD